MPLAIHGAPSRGLGFDFFESFVEVHALEHPLPLMIQLTNMIFQGVFELFPQLRVAYLEAGAGWMPFMMDRLDEDFERRGKKWAPRLKQAAERIYQGRAGLRFAGVRGAHAALCAGTVRRGSYFFRFGLSARAATRAVSGRHSRARSARGYFRSAKRRFWPTTRGGFTG